MPYDLLLKNGTLVDPAQGLHAGKDVAFADGRVAAVADHLPEAEARHTVDCAGRIVAPGLIDLHVHVFWGVSHYGIPPDPHCIARGVTTAVDAGSAGADTFPGFRKYVIEASDTRLFAMLNISAMGMVSAEIGELQDIRWASVPKALACIEANRDRILGVKVRLDPSVSVSEASGIRPLFLAREAADAAGLPLMVHPQDAYCDSLDDIVSVLRDRDILTHTFHSAPRHGVLDERGQIRDSVRAARERGVIFDVGHGAGSFNWDVAERALAQGFVPQTISSDLHVYDVDGPVYDLATTVSKFLHLGLSLDDALRRVTATPAAAIRCDELGTLRAGAWGDAVVLDLQAGGFDFTDSDGHTRTARQRLVPVAVVRGGAVYGAER